MSTLSSRGSAQVQDVDPEQRRSMGTRTQSDIENDPRVDEAVARIPQKLYRCYGVTGPRLDWLQTLLVESRMYFSSPSEFNDPLDCRIAPTFNASAEAIRSFWRPRVKRIEPHRKLRENKPAIERLVRESKTDAGRARLEKVVFESLNRNGVACFARSATNTLMWSYYARGHAGVAVRFNMNHVRFLRPLYLYMPVEVQYSHTIPEVNFYTTPTFELLITMLGTKAKAWSHEEEWRLVVVAKTGYVRFPPDFLDAVILGMRVDAAIEAKVRNWVKHRAWPTALMRVQNVPGTFDLTIVDAG